MKHPVILFTYIYLLISIYLERNNNFDNFSDIIFKYTKNIFFVQSEWIHTTGDPYCNSSDVVIPRKIELTPPDLPTREIISAMDDYKYINSY